MLINVIKCGSVISEYSCFLNVEHVNYTNLCSVYQSLYMSAYGGLLMSSNQTENNSLVCVEYNLYFTQCEAVYNNL